MTHGNPAAFETLSASQVSALLEAGSILLVDVREPAEYGAERIPGALLFPLSTFDAGKLPPDQERRVVFHCGSGKRSAAACEQRLGAGAPRAAHLGGGIAAWKSAGLRVIRIDSATGQPTIS